MQALQGLAARIAGHSIVPRIMWGSHRHTRRPVEHPEPDAQGLIKLQLCMVSSGLRAPHPRHSLASDWNLVTAQEPDNK